MHINSTTTTTTTTTTTDRSSFFNNQEPKKAHGRIVYAISREDPNRIIYASSLKEIENSLNEQKELKEQKEQKRINNLLQPDEWGLIFSYLHHKDIISTLLSFKNAEIAVNSRKAIMYNAYFSLFTSQQRASFKKFTQNMPETKIHRWLCQFATKESVNKFLKEQSTPPSTTSLIYKRTQSMRTSPTFKVEEECTITHVKTIRSATFSANGLHLVTDSYGYNMTQIHGQESNGKWAFKPTANNLIESATFSPDDSHMITTNADHTATIYGHESSDEWVEKGVIQYPAGYPDSTTFSNDGLHVMLASRTYTDSAVTICGRDSNGEWTPKALIKNNSGNTTAIFSPNSHNVLITDSYKSTQIYEQDSSGNTWTEKYTPELNKPAVLATFSADSRHVAIIHTADMSTGIYGQDLNGEWTQKIFIKNTHPPHPFPIKPTFSNDGRFVMINSDHDKAVTICVQSSSGKWTKQKNSGCDADVTICMLRSSVKWTKHEATIQHQAKVQSMTFSSDSHHIMTSSRDGVVQICSKSADDQWIKKATTQYKYEKGVVRGRIISTFSADSRQLLIASTAHKTIKIYRWTFAEEWTKSHTINIDAGWTSDEEWLEIHASDIDADKSPQTATFSADGSHVIIVATGIIKIYGLISTGGKETWKEKAQFKHIGADRASISADGGHVVTVHKSDGTAKIWRLSSD